MHVVVNAAESVDGKLSTRRRDQVRISGPADFERVDRLRAASDAVMVGVGTVIADDPHLTLDDDERRDERRRDGRPGDPARIVADSQARIHSDARVLDDAAPTFVLVAEAAPVDERERLHEAGAEIIVAGDEQVDLAAALGELAGNGIDRLLVEGGGELIFSLFAADLVDELSVFVGSTIIGGREAPTLADGDGFETPAEFPSLALESVERLDDGVVLTYEVQ